MVHRGNSRCRLVWRRRLHRPHPAEQWATWVLIASLAGVVLQDLWLFVLSHALSGAGAVGIMLQGIVLIVSIGLVYLARVGSARGWLR